MDIVEWNKKEELITEQALRHIKVINPLPYPLDTRLVSLPNSCIPSLCGQQVLSSVFVDYTCFAHQACNFVADQLISLVFCL